MYFDKVGIIIPFKERVDCLAICLQSIELCSTRYNYSITIVDNNSSESDKQWLSSVTGTLVNIVESDIDIDWLEAFNLGISHTDDDVEFVLSLHPDVVVLSPIWLGVMLSDFTDQDVGISGLALAETTRGENTYEYLSNVCMMVPKSLHVGHIPKTEQPIDFEFGQAVLNMGLKAHAHVKLPLIHHYNIGD